MVNANSRIRINRRLFKQTTTNHGQKEAAEGAPGRGGAVTSDRPGQIPRGSGPDGPEEARYQPRSTGGHLSAPGRHHHADV